MFLFLKVEIMKLKSQIFEHDDIFPLFPCGVTNHTDGTSGKRSAVERVTVLEVITARPVRTDSK